VEPLEGWQSAGGHFHDYPFTNVCKRLSSKNLFNCSELLQLTHCSLKHSPLFFVIFVIVITMSRERKILSHPLLKPSIQKKVEKAVREVKEYREAREGRLVKKSSDKKR
jgi:hypothetical protein